MSKSEGARKGSSSEEQVASRSDNGKMASQTMKCSGCQGKVKSVNLSCRAIHAYGSAIEPNFKKFGAEAREELANKHFHF